MRAIILRSRGHRFESCYRLKVAIKMSFTSPCAKLKSNVAFMEHPHSRKGVTLPPKSIPHYILPSGQVGRISITDQFTRFNRNVLYVCILTFMIPSLSTPCPDTPRKVLGGGGQHSDGFPLPIPRKIMKTTTLCKLTPPIVDTKVQI